MFRKRPAGVCGAFTPPDPVVGTVVDEAPVLVVDADVGAVVGGVDVVAMADVDEVGAVVVVDAEALPRELLEPHPARTVNSSVKPVIPASGSPNRRDVRNDISAI